MAELAWSGALERTAVGVGGSALIDEAGLQVRIADVAQSVVTVHLRASDEAALRATLEAPVGVTGYALPSTPNTRTGDDADYVAWLDPSRWLAVSAIEKRWARLRELQTAIARASPDACATDVSDALVVLDIDGGRAPMLMAMACALDIDGAAFAPPRTARAPFAQTGSALLYRYRSGYRVHIDGSLIAHVRDWLAQAVRLLPDK